MPARSGKWGNAGQVTLVFLLLVATVWLITGGLSSSGTDLNLIVVQPIQQLRTQGHVDLGYPYPLWTPLLLSPFALVALPVAAQLWLGVSLLLVALTAVYLTRFFHWHRALSLFVAVCIVVQDRSVVGLWLGQITFILLVTVVLLAHMVAAQHWGRAGLLLGACLIKPHVAILVILGVLGWGVWQQRWRLLVAFSTVAAALLALAAPFVIAPSQLLGGGIGHHLLGGLENGSTLWGLALWVWPRQLWLPLIGCGLLLGWLGYEWLLALRTKQIEQRWPYLLAVTLIINLLVLPYSWSYNLTLLVYPVCYVLDRGWRVGGMRRWTCLIATMFLLYPGSRLIDLYLVTPHRLDVFYAIIPLLLLPLVIVVERQSERVVPTPADADPALALALS